MNKGIEIARGKTKVLYENPGQPDQLVVAQTDSISSGDGVRRNVIAGKGRLAAQTTARVFRLLNLCGLPTHYLNGGEDDDNNEMVVRRCNMIPLEEVSIDAPRDSDAWYLALMAHQFPGSFLPYGQEQVVECADPRFRLLESSSGRLFSLLKSPT